MEKNVSCRYGSMSCRILDRPVLFGLIYLTGNLFLRGYTDR